MASNDHARKKEEILRAIKLGAEQVLAGGRTVPIKGTVLDQASLDQVVGGHLAPYQEVHDTRAALAQAVLDRRAKEQAAKDFVRDFRNAAAAAFGEDSPEFAQFGFQPRKNPIPLTPEQKEHRVEQLRATRLARHTLGKRQRMAVKGVVDPDIGVTDGAGGGFG